MGLVAGLSVLDGPYEMVDAVAQEFRFGVFWHTVDAVIVNDVGIDEWVAPGSERGTELDGKASERSDSSGARELVLALITRILVIDRFDDIEVPFQRNVPSVVLGVVMTQEYRYRQQC